MLVKHLVGVCLMLGIVLAEHEIHEPALGVHDGERIELVFPNDVVRFLEGRTFGSGYELFKRRHKFADTKLRTHAADTVVTARNDAEELSVCGAVVGDRHGGVAVFRFKLKHIRQSLLRHDI